MKIEGTLFFENSLDCSAVLSGAELPVSVGGVQGVFALPRLAQRNSGGEHIVSPPPMLILKFRP